MLHVLPLLSAVMLSGPINAAPTDSIVTFPLPSGFVETSRSEVQGRRLENGLCAVQLHMRLHLGERGAATIVAINTQTCVYVVAKGQIEQQDDPNATAGFTKTYYGRGYFVPMAASVFALTGRIDVLALYSMLPLPRHDILSTRPQPGS